MLKVNFENLKKAGFDFSNISEIIEQLKSNVEFLELHNKNYTKKQYFLISDCLAILQNLQTKDVKMSETEKELNKLITEYGIAKENCYKLLENPNALIDCQGLSYWASRVEFLRNYI